MGGLPTLLVELDDGTGTFPHDITAYVDLSQDWSVNRGRADNFDSIDPSSLTISMKNNQGHFTLGSPTFGIFVDQMIRVTETLGATTSPRFTGYVQNWPTSWDSPIGNRSTTTITAVDRLARLERRRLRAMLEQEILLDSPLAYYTLGEPEGAVAGGDTSGKSQPALGIVGSGTPLAFGADGGPVNSGSAVQFNGGTYLSGSINAAGATGNCLILECWFSCSAAPTAPHSEVLVRAYGADGTTLLADLNIDYTGELNWYVPGGVPSGFFAASPLVTDGRQHHAVLIRTGGGSFYGYLDGVLKGGYNPGWAAPYSPASIDVGGDRTGAHPNSNVTVSHVAVYNDNQATGISTFPHAVDHYAAGTGFAGEATDTRVGRLAFYANIAPADTDLETGTADLAVQATVGASVMDALNDAVTTEGGALFVAGDGKLTLQNRTHRVHAATSTPTVALVTEDTNPGDLTWSGDKNYLINYVEGSRPDGATQVVQDDASIGQFEQYPSSVSLLVQTDAEVLAAAQWQVYAYAEPKPRLTSVTIDLLTLADGAKREAILALELGSRITISGFPSQSPVATADLIVEGSQESQSIDSWSITFNTVSAETFRAWVIEDPVYGVLGSTTKLYY
jgi:hypothetical protein